MKTLTYHSQSPFAALADKAARMWNRALRCEVLRPAEIAQILIGYGAVDTRTQPGRVAQHERVGDLHRITLRPDIQWRITFWQRFLGLGDEDALSALLHEFGHALGLPHSTRVSDVMHADLGTTIISSDEAERYRRFLNL
jgi:hypothetical protein